MAETPAGYIGLQGQRMTPVLQNEPDTARLDMIGAGDTIRREAEQKRKDDLEAKNKADELVTDIFKNMINVTAPMLPARREEVKQKKLELLNEMYQKRTENPLYNPVVDPDTSQMLTDLAFRTKEYSKEYGEAVKDFQYAKEHGLSTELVPGIESIFSVEDPQELQGIIGERYTPGSAYKTTYKKFYTQDFIKKNAPQFRTKVVNDMGQSVDETIVGFDPSDPEQKRVAENLASNIIAAGTYQSLGALEAAQERVLQEQPELAKEKAVLAQAVRERAEQDLLKAWEINQLRTVTDNEKSKQWQFGAGGASQVVTPDGSWTLGDQNARESYIRAESQRVAKKVIGDLMAEKRKEQEKAFATKASARTEAQKSLIRQDLDAIEQDLLQKAIQTETQKLQERYSGYDFLVITPTGKKEIGANDVAGQPSIIAINQDGKIEGTLVRGKDGEKAIPARGTQIAQSVTTALPSIYEAYPKLTGRQGDFSEMVVGKKAEANERKGGGGSPAPKKPKTKERLFIVGNKAYPESALIKQGWDVKKLKEYKP